MSLSQALGKARLHTDTHYLMHYFSIRWNVGCCTVLVFVLPFPASSWKQLMTAQGIIYICLLPKDLSSSWGLFLLPNWCLDGLCLSCFCVSAESWAESGAAGASTRGRMWLIVRVFCKYSLSSQTANWRLRLCVGFVCQQSVRTKLRSDLGCIYLGKLWIRV